MLSNSKRKRNIWRKRKKRRRRERGNRAPKHSNTT
jgi:hypothetical protein